MLSPCTRGSAVMVTASGHPHSDRLGANRCGRAAWTVLWVLQTVSEMGALSAFSLGVWAVGYGVTGFILAVCHFPVINDTGHMNKARS